MAKYTFELRELFEPLKFNPPLFTREEVERWFKDYDLYDYLTIEQVKVIEEFNVWNKDKLARKIVDHYYMRESGFETPALFKHYAKVEMQEIMEEYLPLIYRLFWKINWFHEHLQSCQRTTSRRIPGQKTNRYRLITRQRC